jgi:hypothetical protein
MVHHHENRELLALTVLKRRARLRYLLNLTPPAPVRQSFGASVHSTFWRASPVAAGSGNTVGVLGSAEPTRAGLDTAPQGLHGERATSQRFGPMPRSALSLGFLLLGVAACASDTTPSRLIGPQNAVAITYGSVDQNNTYSNVAAFIVLRKSDGEIFPICSGTLIAPTVFLTAGHCTAYFATLSPSKYAAGVSFGNPIAWGALTDSHAKVILATSVITNPEYNHRQSDPADLGVLLLAAGDTRGITAAALPTLGLLDQLFVAGTLQSKRFTAVGYGLQNRVVGGGQPYFQDLNPIPRMYALSSFSALDPGYLRLSQNPATGDGGTCYGDSGGPNFLNVGGTLILAATTVTGDNVCRATNVDYRLDTQTARRFLGQYATLP